MFGAYGWRVLVPLLMVLTVVAWFGLPRWFDPPPAAPQQPAQASTDTGPPSTAPTTPAATENSPKDLNIPTAVLPEGGAYTQAGAGTWHVVPPGGEKVGSAAETFTYTVEVEDGIDPAGYGGDEAFANMVDATLADPRGWTGGGEVSLRRLDAGQVPDIRISLTSPATTHQVCGFSIKYESSCHHRQPGANRVVINLARWVRGAIAFQGDMGSYRQYLINHEVGHALGNGHAACPSDGALAPVMMQQTFGVANDYVAMLNESAAAGSTVPADGKVCKPNAWPNPQATPG